MYVFPTLITGVPSSSGERSSTPIAPPMPSAYTSSSSSSACTQSTGVRSVVSSNSDANGKLSVPSMNPASACHVTEDECSRDAIQCCCEI